MRTAKFGIGLVASLVAGAPLDAQGVVEKKPDGVTVQANSRAKLVCKTERVTGSMVHVERTCATQREWDNLSDRSQDDLQRFDRNVREYEMRRAGSAGPMPGL